jgi:hydroxylysine kinase
LVASDDPAYVTGVIDFGDVVHSYRVWDVAVGLAYETPSAYQVRDPWGPLMEMLRGYQHRSSLSGDELNLLPTLILARLLQRYIIGTWLATRVPENAVYTTRHHDAIWNQIDNIARAESRMQNPG